MDRRCSQSVRHHIKNNVGMGNVVLRQSTQNLWNLVTGALRVTVINTSGDNMDRPDRQVVKAEEEVHESELGKAGLHPWDGGPGQALAFSRLVGELTGFCRPCS